MGHVRLLDEAIETALDLSPRYMRHLHLPDKVIRWLDTAAVRAEIDRRWEVKKEDVVSVISHVAQIPEDMVFRDVADRFKDIEERLQLKNNPYCVILLDEIEKASPNTLNLFLQAFDEGWLTDGRGKRVYLSDAVVIMTANLGAENFRKLANPMGFLNRAVNIEQVQGEIMRELERRFPPEFRNRIDEVVLFAPLTHAEVREIAKHYLEQVKVALAKAGKTIHVSDEALEMVVTIRVQHRLRRPFPQALHRRADQAADQRALEGRLPLHG